MECWPSSGGFGVAILLEGTSQSGGLQGPNKAMPGVLGLGVSGS